MIRRVALLLCLVLTLGLVSACGGSQPAPAAKPAPQPAAKAPAEAAKPAPAQAAPAKPAAAPAPAAPAKPPLKIKIAYAGEPETKDLPSVLAWRSLPKDKYAIELVPANGTSGAATVVINGEVDMARTSVPLALNGILKGAQIKALAEGYGNVWALVAHKSITKPEQLDGKTVGLSSTGDLLDVLFKTQILDKYPVKPNIVRARSSADRVQALVKGTMDAIVGSLEDAVFAEETKPGTFYTMNAFGKTVPKLAGSYFFARDEFIKNNPEAVQDMMEALLTTHRRIADDPNYLLTEWKKAYPEQKPENLQKVLQLSMDTKLWDVNAKMDKETLTFTHDFYLNSDGIPKAVPLEQWAAAQYIEKSIQKLGKR